LNNNILVGVEYAVENSSRSTYTGLSSSLTAKVATTLGLCLQDALDLTPQRKLVGGVRLDKFSGDYDRSGSVAPNNTPLSRSDTLLSKRLGSMCQPTDEVCYCASYGTSFNTSGDLYQFDPRSANTPPESSRNIEVDAKRGLYKGDLSLRTALTRTDKNNERNTDIDTATNCYLLSGKRHTDALEFEVAGRINPQWDIFAGLGFLRAVINQAGSNEAGQAEVGQNSGLSPSRQATLFSTYRINQSNAPKLNIDNLFDKVCRNTLYRGFAALAACRTFPVNSPRKRSKFDSKNVKIQANRISNPRHVPLHRCQPQDRLFTAPVGRGLAQ